MMSTSIIVEEWRDLWSFKLDFIVASIAYVFSITNFFELPKLIYTEGGLAFVAGYVASILICCLPIIVMELAVGQLTGRAPVQALLSVCPLFKGVGVAQVLYSLAWMSYVAVWIGYLCLYIFYFFFYIVKPESPWLGCENDWNESPCTVPSNISGSNAFRLNDDVYDTSISQFQKYLVNPAEDIKQIEMLQWIIICGAGAVWLCVFVAIMAGVRWLGKVCYITLIVPFLFFTAIFVYILIKNIDIAESAGVRIFELTDWNKMLEWEFWQIVFKQSFYATGLGFGAFITLGSYNKRNNNLVCDALLIVLFHLFLSALMICTSLACAYYIGGVLGVDDPVEYFLKTYNPNSFIKQMHFFIAAVGAFPDVDKVWTGILLFAVVLTSLNTFYILGLNLLATLEDAFGEKASRCAPRFVLAALICVFGCGLSLIHTTEIGPFTLELTDRFLDYLTPWVIIIFELLAIAWFYCGYMLGKDIKAMVTPCCCWLTGFKLMIPLYLLPLVPIYIMVAPKSGTLWMYEYATQLSQGVQALSCSEYIGWAIAVVPLLPIPLLMIYMIIKTCIFGPGLTRWQRFKYTIISPLRYEIVKPTPPPRYTATAPGYVLLPQAPLAEPENYTDVYGEHAHVRT